MTELGHVVLYVHNLERSVAFYRDLVGFQTVGEIDPSVMKAAIFSSGRTHHELLLLEVGEDAAEIPAGRRVGLYHIGLKVGENDDDLREVLDRLNNSDARVVGSSDHGVTHSLYVLDPDGNEIELFIDVPGVDWKNPASMMVPIKPLKL
ncbi:MAG: VOC family protein [Ilumatobacteraceae bacterium]|nr:VOC family protein [Ilumatobacteraceae bacterium]